MKSILKAVVLSTLCTKPYSVPIHISDATESVVLRGSLPKTGPLRFGSENRFPLNFAHEYILVQK